MRKLVETHQKESKIATLSIVKPSGREQLLPLDPTGTLRYESSFQVENGQAWINGDCFVFSPKVFRFLAGNYELEKYLLADWREYGR